MSELPGMWEEADFIDTRDMLPAGQCDKEAHQKYGACYNCCERCNYDRHVCHFCGDSLTHNSYSHGERHLPQDCRPDLFPHEPGPICTWAYRRLDTEVRWALQDICYAYNEEGEHVSFS